MNKKQKLVRKILLNLDLILNVDQCDSTLLLKSQLEDISCSLSEIMDYCVDDLMCKEYDPFNDDDMWDDPYKWIGFELDNPLLTNLNQEILYAFKGISEIERIKSEGLKKFFPQLKPYKIEGNEAIEMTAEEVNLSEINRQMKSMELEDVGANWVEDFVKIREIIDRRGNLSDIIKLL